MMKRWDVSGTERLGQEDEPGFERVQTRRDAEAGGSSVADKARDFGERQTLAAPFTSEGDRSSRGYSDRGQGGGGSWFGGGGGGDRGYDYQQGYGGDRGRSSWLGGYSDPRERAEDRAERERYGTGVSGTLRQAFGYEQPPHQQQRQAEYERERDRGYGAGQGVYGGQSSSGGSVSGALRHMFGYDQPQQPQRPADYDRDRQGSWFGGGDRSYGSRDYEPKYDNRERRSGGGSWLGGWFDGGGRRDYDPNTGYGRDRGYGGNAPRQGMFAGSVDRPVAPSERPEDVLARLDRSAQQVGYPRDERESKRWDDREQRWGGERSREADRSRSPAWEGRQQAQQPQLSQQQRGGYGGGYGRRTPPGVIFHYQDNGQKPDGSRGSPYTLTMFTVDPRVQADRERQWEAADRHYGVPPPFEQAKRQALRRMAFSHELCEKMQDRGLSQNEILYNVEKLIDELDRRGNDRFYPATGRAIMLDLRDILIATFNLIQNKRGLTDTIQELFRETYLAVQQASREGVFAPATGIYDERLKERARSAVSRAFSVFRALVWSHRGREIALKIARLLRLVFEEAGDKIEQRLTETAGYGTSESRGRGGEWSQGPSQSGGQSYGQNTSRAFSGRGGSLFPDQGSYKERDIREGPGMSYERERVSLGPGPSASGGSPFGSSRPRSFAVREQHEREFGYPPAPPPSPQFGPSGQSSGSKQRMSGITNLVRSIFQTAASEPRLRDALWDLLEIGREYQRRAEQALDSAAQYGAGSPAVQVHANRAAVLLERLLMEIAPGTTLQRLKLRLGEIAQLSKTDPRVREFFHNLGRFVEYSLENPDFVASDSFPRRVESMATQAREAFSAVSFNVRGMVDELNNLLSDLVNGIQSDKPLMDFVNAWHKLAGEFVTRDIQGRLRLDSQAFREFGEVLAPMIAERTRYVAIPPIRYIDDAFDVLVDELVLYTPELPPSAIEVHTGTSFGIDLINFAIPRTRGTMTIVLRDVKVVAKNFFFSVKRKTFPQLEDSGHADLVTSGRGITVVTSFDHSTSYPFFSNVRAKCNIDQIHIEIGQDAKHTTLANWFLPSFSNTLKTQVEQAVEASIARWGNEWAERANAVIASYYPQGLQFGNALQNWLSQTWIAGVPEKYTTRRSERERDRERQERGFGAPLRREWPRESERRGGGGYGREEEREKDRERGWGGAEEWERDRERKRKRMEEGADRDFGDRDRERERERDRYGGGGDRGLQRHLEREREQPPQQPQQQPDYQRLYPRMSEDRGQSQSQGQGDRQRWM